MVGISANRNLSDMHGLVFCRNMVLHHLWTVRNFVIPFRLLTRSGRNRKRNKLQHRELLAAVREERSANMDEKQTNEEKLTDEEIVTVILPTINNDGK